MVCLYIKAIRQVFHPLKIEKPRKILKNGVFCMFLFIPAQTRAKPVPVATGTGKTRARVRV